MLRAILPVSPRLPPPPDYCREPRAASRLGPQVTDSPGAATSCQHSFRTHDAATDAPHKVGLHVIYLNQNDGDESHPGSYPVQLAEGIICLHGRTVNTKDVAVSHVGVNKSFLLTSRRGVDEESNVYGDEADAAPKECASNEQSVGRDQTPGYFEGEKEAVVPSRPIFNARAGE